MLVLLDRSTNLVGPTPPASLPSSEYQKFLDYFHAAAASSGSTTAPAGAQAPHSLRESAPAPSQAAAPPGAPEEQLGLRLLRRWYRQSRHSASGGPDGEFELVTPPDLASAVESVFSPEATVRVLQVLRLERDYLLQVAVAVAAAAAAAAAAVAAAPANTTTTHD